MLFGVLGRFLEVWKFRPPILQWSSIIILDGDKRWSILCLALPLNTFGHDFNRFCDISFQNLKSRFFPIFGGSFWLWTSVKLRKNYLRPPRFGQKLPLIFPVKVIKSQSRRISYLKMTFFLRPRGSIVPPSRIGLNSSKCKLFINQQK